MAKILVADDEEIIGRMVEFRLSNAGHEIVRARDGKEALEYASSKKPDLVLLDVLMPVFDGLEVLERIKEDPALATIPVIMLTAKGRESDVVAGFKRGAIDYIIKPFSLSELTARVDAALANEPVGA